MEKDTDMLLSTLSAMQEKAQHLEYNLSAETRIKLDLFSALGDARRQLEIAQGSHTNALCSFILILYRFQLVVVVMSVKTCHLIILAQWHHQVDTPHVNNQVKPFHNMY